MEQKYCAAPWRGLHVNLDGDVRVCCSGKPGLFGNINRQSIDEILKSKSLIDIRRSIISGKLHQTYCEPCIAGYAQGQTERNWHNDTNPEFFPGSATEYDEHIPTIIDIRWNNTCNLSCTYCSPYFSSTWGQISGQPIRSVNRQHFEELRDFVVKNSGHIKDLALLGGEPLLLSWNKDIIEVLPESTQVTIITNLNVQLDNNDIFNQLKQRRNVHWRISAENIGDRFEYVRRKGSWKLLCSNIDKIKNISKHLIGFHSVYHVYNCTRLYEFRSWAATQANNVLWQPIGQDHLDPRYHHGLKSLIRQEIDKLLTIDIGPGERTFFNNILNTLESDTRNLRKEFNEHVTCDETKYFRDAKFRFKELWPELSWMIDGT